MDKKTVAGSAIIGTALVVYAAARSGSPAPQMKPIPQATPIVKDEKHPNLDLVGDYAKFPLGSVVYMDPSHFYRHPDGKKLVMHRSEIVATDPEAFQNKTPIKVTVGNNCFMAQGETEDPKTIDQEEFTATKSELVVQCPKS